jgi:hypothetical protein
LTVIIYVKCVCIFDTEGLQIKDRLLTPFLKAAVKGKSVHDNYDDNDCDDVMMIIMMMMMMVINDDDNDN